MTLFGPQILLLPLKFLQPPYTKKFYGCKDSGHMS